MKKDMFFFFAQNDYSSRFTCN